VLTSLLTALFAGGIGLALAAGNVYFRDLSYLWGIVVQGWFFATPIVYDPGLAERRLADHRTLLRVYNNQPMAVVARVFRNLMYDMRMPRLLDYSLLVGYAFGALLIGWWIFDRLEGRFAEEL